MFVCFERETSNYTKKKEQRLNESQGQGDQDSPLVPTVAVTDRLRDIATPQQQRHDKRLFPNQIQMIPFIDWSGNGLHWRSSFLVLTHTDTHLYPGGRSNLTLPLGTAIHAQSFYKDATSATILGISILPEDTCDGGWGPWGPELDDGDDSSKEQAECTH